MYLRLNGHVPPQRKEPNTVNFHHHTEAAAAFLRSPIGRRVGTLGVATAAIIGVAVGPAAVATSPTPQKAPATVSWATGTPASHRLHPHGDSRRRPRPPPPTPRRPRHRPRTHRPRRPRR